MGRKSLALEVTRVWKSALQNPALGVWRPQTFITGHNARNAWLPFSWRFYVLTFNEDIPGQCFEESPLHVLSQHEHVENCQGKDGHNANGIHAM